MHKLKNLKKIIKHYKWLSISVLAILVLIPAFVLAVNDPQTGYIASKNAVSIPMFYVAEDGLGVERVGFCVGNGSSNNYFIPTAKFTDIMAFFNNKPSGVALVECVGDGQCTGSESCSNAPEDCGLCGDITPIDDCARSCISSCPCSTDCSINCSYSGGSDSGGSGGCVSNGFYYFYASC